MSAADWAVHLPTADQTCVRLAIAPRGPADPWPFTVAVTELGRLGATGRERFRSLGRGTGEPLLASQELAWHGCSLHLESRLDREGRGELSLELPCWDELCQRDATEDDFWDLVDALAAAASPTHGAVTDGEALDPAPPRTRAECERALDRHLALLLPPGSAELSASRAARYRELPRSGLAVLLR